MRLLLSTVSLVMMIMDIATAAETVAACQARHKELTAKVADFKGEPMMKRLIQADLDRANREMIEGDADECTEALDHATKLLAGDV